MLVGGKLVAVASVDCKIVGVMIIVRRAMTTGHLLGIRNWFVLHCCHLLINTVVLTPPALVLNYEEYGQLHKNILFHSSVYAIPPGRIKALIL